MIGVFILNGCTLALKMTDIDSTYELGFYTLHILGNLRKQNYLVRVDKPDYTKLQSGATIILDESYHQVAHSWAV